MVWLLGLCSCQNSQVSSPAPLSFTSWTMRVRVGGCSQGGRGGPWVALGLGSNSQTMQLHMSATTAQNLQKKKGQKDLRGKLGVHSCPASDLGPVL